MSNLDLIWCLLVLLVSGGGCDSGPNEALPSWITSKPAFQNPTREDSVESGFGAISYEKKGEAGWLVTLNEKEGHGVELELQKLSMNPDLNDFLLVSPWPMTGSFKRIKLYSGKFGKPLKPLRIPNTKTFFVLYSVSQATTSPEIVLSYKRYGSPLELTPFPTSDPIKKRETVYEIQLRGKAPEEYRGVEFLNEVKEAIRARAKRYCAAHGIKFSDDLPTEKMVLIHTVSFCPFEWPDREVCASLEHSVFVSGVKLPDQELIKDYELVKSNLKRMWEEGDLAELEALGITVAEAKKAMNVEEEGEAKAGNVDRTQNEEYRAKERARKGKNVERIKKVFRLPSTSGTAAFWSLLIGFAVVSSLIIALILRKAYRMRISQRKESLEYDEVVTMKTSKFKLHKHQTVPAFILNERDPNMVRLEGQLQKEISEYDAVTAKQPESQKSYKVPTGNYAASVIFGDNKAFDDDEDDTVQFRRKTPPRK